MFKFETWKDRLCCPQCAATIIEDKGRWHCDGCKSSFPALDGVPALFAQPSHAIGEWRGRYELLLRTLERDRMALETDLRENEGALLPTTEKRLTHVVHALRDQQPQIQKLLSGLALGQRSQDWLTAMKFRLPPSQTLNNYYPNIFRDWSWGEKENQRSVQQITALDPQNQSWGHALVLGSGSGRLAYDLAKTVKATAILATDINPFLVTVAARLYRGETLSLWEFPFVPRGVQASAVQHTLHAPGVAPSHLHLAYTDLYRPPVKMDSFDTVLTPWLIDILPENARWSAARVNRLLRVGGHWIWTGPVGFRRARQSELYTAEEVLELVRAAGFEVLKSEQTEEPYLQSPHSEHYRVERVLHFRAQKKESTTLPPTYQNLPGWLTEFNRPIPSDPMFQSLQRGHAALSEFLGAIDGRASLAEVATKLANKHGLDPASAAESLVHFFLKLVDESVPGTL